MDTEHTNDLIQEWLKIASKSDKELYNFIKKHLYIKRPLYLESIQNHLNAFKKMNNVQTIILKARADSFKESNEPSKYIPMILTFFSLAIALLTLCFQFISHPIARYMLEGALSILLILLFIIGVRIIKAFKIYPKAVYFQSIIANLDTYEEDETE